jgi:FAD/FMN-containing dehydrogenase
MDVLDTTRASRPPRTETALAGWGNYPRLRTTLYRPRDVAELQTLVADSPSLVARGNGRSYGDPTLNPQSVVSLGAFDRILDFDAAAGRITCGAGLLLADLLPVIVAAGWFVPVTPGTRWLTLGGMLAADVHSKRLAAPGFGAHVEALTLVTPDGERRHCTPAATPELFRATVGGMGLTGFVVDLTFRLIPVETAWLHQETVAAPDLDALLELFERADGWPYAVAWIDCLTGGRHRGRALFHRGRHAHRDELPAHVADPSRPPPRRQRRVPVVFPDGVLNGASVRLFNEAYYRLGRRKAGPAWVDYETFFYPLDGLSNWNRIYGRRGFTQYQCVLPRHTARAGLHALLEAVGAAGRGSFLAVLKRLGDDDSGYLAFPRDGYTLALDFPMARGVLALLDRLDRITTAHGGRLYLAKDARAAPRVFAAGYPELDAFRAVRAEIDPAGKLQSRQSIRLGL